MKHWKWWVCLYPTDTELKISINAISAKHLWFNPIFLFHTSVVWLKVFKCRNTVSVSKPAALLTPVLWESKWIWRCGVKVNLRENCCNLPGRHTKKITFNVTVMQSLRETNRFILHMQSARTKSAKAGLNLSWESVCLDESTYLQELLCCVKTCRASAYDTHSWTRWRGQPTHTWQCDRNMFFIIWHFTTRADWAIASHSKTFNTL